MKIHGFWDMLLCHGLHSSQISEDHNTFMFEE